MDNSPKNTAYSDSEGEQPQAININEASTSMRGNDANIKGDKGAAKGKPGAEPAKQLKVQPWRKFLAQPEMPVCEDKDDIVRIYGERRARGPRWLERRIPTPGHVQTSLWYHSSSNTLFFY